VDDHDGILPAEERGDPLLEVGQGVTMLGEQDQLLAG